MKRFNLWLAEKITTGVATMWCAYLFAAIALISLPKALQSGDSIVIVSWVAVGSALNHHGWPKGSICKCRTENR
jgi:hypothetical protein